MTAAWNDLPDVVTLPPIAPAAAPAVSVTVAPIVLTPLGTGGNDRDVPPAAPDAFVTTAEAAEIFRLRPAAFHDARRKLRLFPDGRRGPSGALRFSRLAVERAAAEHAAQKAKRIAPKKAEFRKDGPLSVLPTEVDLYEPIELRLPTLDDAPSVAIEESTILDRAPGEKRTRLPGVHVAFTKIPIGPSAEARAKAEAKRVENARLLAEAVAAGRVTRYSPDATSGLRWNIIGDLFIDNRTAAPAPPRIRTTEAVEKRPPSTSIEERREIDAIDREVERDFARRFRDFKETAAADSTAEALRERARERTRVRLRAIARVHAEALRAATNDDNEADDSASG